jgi:hypothetical protein
MEKAASRDAASDELAWNHGLARRTREPMAWYALQ